MDQEQQLWFDSWRIDGTTPEPIRRKAQEWYRLVSTEKYYITCIMFRFCHQGVWGVAMACSTAASTRQAAINRSMNENNQVITFPSWCLYEVYFYPGASLMNMAGLRHPLRPYALLGLLWQVFDSVWPPGGSCDWRAKYALIDGGRYRTGLRRAIMDLKVSEWLEVTVGRSWQGIGALDFYLRIHSTTAAPEEEEEAWYLLNTEVPIERRELPRPENWYYYSNFQAYGQRPLICEWEVLTVDSSLTRARM